MKMIPVQHADSQHLKIDDIMSATGLNKSTVVRAALFIGLQSICSELNSDKEKAIANVSLTALKAK